MRRDKSAVLVKAAKERESSNPADHEQVRVNLDVAWRTHAAQESWVAKVDTKASILLALNGVILGAVFSAWVQKDSFIRVLTGPRAVLLAAAAVLCAMAGLLAAMVIYPLLGRRSHGGAPGTIYFGDLRRRPPAQVAAQMAAMTAEDQFAQVARQLVAMARATWLKHRLMQVALAVTMTGLVLIVIVMLT